MTLVAAGMMLVAAIEPETASRWLSIAAAFTALSVVCLVLNRRGRTRFAARLVLTGLTVILTYLAWTGGGVRAPAVICFLIVIVGAGLMLGARAGLFAGIACMLIELLLAWLASAGYLTSAARSHGPYAIWIIHTMYAGMLLVSVGLFTDRIGKALQASERELAERRRVQNELEASEEQFRTIVESAATGISLITPGGVRLRSNPAFSRIFGHAEAELAGAPFDRLTHPEDAPREREQFDAAILGQRESVQLEMRYRHRDGQFVWGRSTISVVRDPDGAPRFAIQMVEDVSDRKRVETERVELDHRLQERVKELTTLHLVAHVMQRGGASREVLLANVVLLLPPAMELPERAAARIRVGSDEAATAGFLERAPLLRADFRTAQGEDGMIEVMYRDVDGEDTPTVFLAEERTLVRTIAEMLRLDLDRHQAESELRESESRYRDLVESARDVIFTIGTDASFLTLNQSFETTFGWPRAEWIGRSFAEVIHADDQELGQQIFRILMNGDLPPLHEVRVRTSSGGYATCEVTAAPQFDHGKVVGVLGIARDITERRALEEQARRAQRVESIGTLASGIAHDLNNVLAPILFSLDILGRRVTDEKARPTIEALRKSAFRGSAIVKQVLAFARGGTEGKRTPQQLRFVVDEVVTLVLGTFPKNIELEKKVPRDLPLISGDPTQLHQIVMNLCVNARDAMPDGGRLTISAESVEGGGASGHGFVRLVVADTGTGMPPEVRERIFEPFFTTKDVGKGTGLGLSTVYSIVRDHGGTIEVDSSPGQGTKFGILFPAISETMAEQQVEQPALPRGAGQRILVVDDEAPMLVIARDTLDAYGYVVDTARDGVESSLAFSAQPRGTYALVVTDLQMPRMGGLDAAILMRRHDPDVRILITSGSPMSGKPELTVDGFLAKPYTAESLLMLIHEVLTADRKPGA